MQSLVVCKLGGNIALVIEQERLIGVQGEWMTERRWVPFIRCALLPMEFRMREDSTSIRRADALHLLRCLPSRNR